MPVDGSAPLQIGSVTAPPGSVASGWLPLGEDWQRRTEAVPFALLNGRERGPVVLLQAVSDGDELNGLGVAREILRVLDPARMAGGLVIVFIANPGAFRAGQAADPRDGQKLNRCFPGQPDGSVSERLAYVLFHEVVLHCDLVIDLHQNSDTPMIPEVRVRTGRRGPCHAECLELAVAFGLSHILDQQGPAGQLARAAPAAGIPTIDPELGGNTGIDPHMVELGVRGVRSVLAHCGLLDEPVARAEPFIARRLVPLYAPTGGIVAFDRELGERLRAGQAIAHVADVFRDQPVPVLTPVDGVFWSRRRHPMVERGDSIGAVGVTDAGG